ncbi:hypothetical protein [Thermogemmatispora tikiterensis]|uniref:Uncharacterized protein n=1 Tax=Thermogemmatispora tikiterensis TaxID=1825093 RepID=A0A328VFH0_9CHLR|nr:hypothetical protein [Thermogemmatispora tikiterensis]RAQ94064.1 hypothetical protein A4R35_00870 [Thermogemmatispora tikiterensis]
MVLRRICGSLVLGLLLLTGLVLGSESLKLTAVQATSPSLQTVASVASPQRQTLQHPLLQASVEVSDPDEKGEAAHDQEAEPGLPGGGHQDQGQSDHQFEGIE